MVIKKKYEKMLLRRYERFQRFGFYSEIPSKKYFRKTSYFVGLLLFAIVLIIIITKVFNNSREPVHPFFGIFTYSIAAAGIILKIILSIIFPEIKLNEKGVKILGYDIIFWKDIKSITTRYDSSSNQNIIIKKRSGNVKTVVLKNVNFHTLKIYLRSFLKKYG